MTATLSTLRKDVQRMDAHQLLATQLPIDIRSGVAKLLCPHDLQFSSSRERCDASLSHMSVGDLSLIRLRYGSDVAVIPEPSSGFVMVQFVLSGWIRVEHAGGVIDCRANNGLVLESLDQRRLHWSADCEQIIIPLQRATLARASESLTGRPVPARFAFNPTFHFDSPDGFSLVTFARYLMSLPATGPAGRMPMGALAKEMLAHHLLLNHLDHDKIELPSAAVPYHVHRAEAFMRQHLAEDIDLDRIAAHVGVSARTLSGAFRHFRKAGPIEWLRNMRLDVARVSLQQAEAASVADASRQAGFHHPGRFSHLYQDRFGEPPHVTLAEGRRTMRRSH